MPPGKDQPFSPSLCVLSVTVSSWVILGILPVTILHIKRRFICLDDRFVSGLAVHYFHSNGYDIDLLPDM